MKKSLSVLLATVIALCSLFGVVGFADGGTNKSDALLSGLVNQKSLTVSLDDSNFATIPIKIKNVSLSAQFTKNDSGSYDVKLGGSGKIGPFKSKVIGNNNELNIYFLFFKMNAAALLGDDFSLSALTQEIAPILDMLNEDTLGYLQYNQTIAERDGVYGDVQVEQYVPNLRKIAEALVAASGEEIDISTMTDEQLLTLVMNCDDDAAAELKDLLSMHIEFVYKDGTLVNVRVLTLNQFTGQYTDRMFDLTGDFGMKFKAIESPAKDSAFKSQFFAIDLTGLLTSLLRGIIG